MKKTYYLWLDLDSSTELKQLCYITDYKEVNAEGKIKIDRHGYCRCKLIASGPDKLQVIADGQKILAPDIFNR